MKGLVYKGLHFLFYVLIFIPWFGCSKMDDTYRKFIEDGELRYSKMPDSISILPGNQRAEVWMMISEPNIVMAKVFWNNGRDSVEIPINPSSGSKVVSTIIDSIEEGSYTFEFFTYDSEGNKSVKSDTTGFIYGHFYESGLVNRPIQSSFIDLDAGQSRILWNELTDSTIVGTEIKYKTFDGIEKTMRVASTEEVTLIDDIPQGDSILYRTLYKPVSIAIDTFFTKYETVHLKKMAILLDKTKFSPYELPSDAPTRSGYDITNIWDDDLTGKKEGSWESIDMPSFPFWVTIDMGQVARLDSIHVWQFVNKTSSPLFYQNANIKSFEVWGTSDSEPGDNWDDWSKLGEFKFNKPSGDPDYDTRTPEDIAKGWAGDQFVFNERTQPVKYIRIKVKDVWDEDYNNDSEGNGSGKAHVFIQEINFYGVPQ